MHFNSTPMERIPELMALIVKDFPCYEKSKSESIIIYDGLTLTNIS